MSNPDIDVTAGVADRGRDLRIQGQIIPPPGTTAGQVLTATLVASVLGSNWQTVAASGGITTFFDSTLGAPAASIDSGAVITSGKLFLICTFLVRTVAAGAFDTVVVRCNGDSGAHYDQTQEQ